MTATVQIVDSGRGGSIYYAEGDQTVVFSWEFALPPALVLIFGPPDARWDTHYPWAAGRQEEIYQFVALEVLRRRASGYRAEIDFTTGVIEIREKPGSNRDAWPKPIKGKPQGIQAVPVPPKTERDLAREMEHRTSARTRLKAAEEMFLRDPTFDIEGFLADQIRVLHDARDGLDVALKLAAEHAGERVRHSLLYGSWNHTHCSQDFARLLLDLVGVTPDPDDEVAASMIEGLGFHTSYFTRRAAFDELCRRTGMQLFP